MYNQINLELDKHTDSLYYNRFLNILENKILRNMNKTFKLGLDLYGKVQHRLLLKNKALNVKKGKWARKRGGNFEKLLKEVFEKYMGLMNVKGLVYRVPSGAFGSQPFDLEWFINGRVFLFECKAKGFQLGAKAGIEHCNRRYECYFKNQDIVKNIISANVPYYFAYKNNTEHNISIVIVPNPVLYRQGTLVRTRRIPLDPSEYMVLPLNPNLWSQDTVEALFSLFTQNNLETDL